MSGKPHPYVARLDASLLLDFVQALFIDAADGILCADAQGRYIEANPRLCELLGYSREELLNLSPAAPLPDEWSALGLPLALMHMDSSSQGKQHRLRRKDGQVLYVEAGIRQYADGRWLGSVRDVTAHKHAEDELKRLNRLYATLSQTNQAIVRMQSREQLFRAVCDVAVEFGEFRMAWIGLLDQESGQLIPVAHAGMDEGYLQLLNINVYNEQRNKGPAGLALRSGETAVIDNVETDPRMNPWREEALKRGYFSSASVPFRRQGKIIGALSLYGNEPGFVTSVERHLLEEIGLDISFALDSMQAEAERKQAESSLRASEERYHSLFDTMLDGFAVHEIICDESGKPVDYRFLQVNPAFEKLTGLRGEEIVGKTVRQVMPDIESSWIDTYGQVSLTGVPVYFESYSQTLNKYYQVVAYSPRKGGFATIFEDITQRRQTEQALRESEARFRSYVEHAPLAILVSDASGHYIDCNPAATTLLGYDATMLRGMSIPDVMATETLPLGAADHQRLVEEGQLERVYRMKRQDGTLIWVALRAVMFSDGHSLAFCQDITAQKEAADALRASEVRYRLLAENMADVVWMLNLRTMRFEYVSPSIERLRGFTAEEMLAEPARERIVKVNTARERQHLPAPLDAFLAGDPSSVAQVEEIELPRKDGSLVWTEVTTNFIKDDDGTIRIIGVSRDISRRKQAEQAMRESEAKFRSYIEHAPQAIFVADASGHYIDCNPAAAQMLGYDVPTLLSMQLTDILLPEDQDAVLREFRGLIAEGRLDHEYRLVKRNGKVIWVALRAVMISTQHAMAFCTDITAQREAEDALRASEARYRLLAENMVDVIWMLNLETWRFEYVSPSVERLHGYTVEEVLAQSVVSMMTPASYNVIMGRLPARMAAFEAGDPSAVSQVDEVEQTRKDGSTVWTDVTTTFIKGNDGVIRVVGVSRDISQRKLAGMALRESEERFRSMAEQMMDVLFVTATDGVIRYISPSSAAIFGWQPEEMIGQNFTRYLIDADIPRAMGNFRTDVELGKPARHLELTMKRKNGSTFLGELNAAARWKDGRTVDVLGLIRDITERKQAEESLRQSEARYRAIVEDQTEFITRWLPDSTLTFANEAYCRFLGKSHAELMERPFLLDEPPEDREAVQQHIARLSLEQPVLNSEERMLLADGTERWVQWTDRALFDADGHVVEVQSAGRDVTERKQMDAELHARTNELEALFALSTALNNAQTEREMLPAILDEVSRALDADACAIALQNLDGSGFTIASASGALLSNTGLKFNATEGLNIGLLKSGRPYLLDDFSQIRHHPTTLAGAEQLGPAVFAPVQSQDQFLGIVAAMRHKDAPHYDTSGMRLMAAGGEMMGNALHRVRLHDRALLRLQYLQILQRIGSAISNSFDLAHILSLLTTEVAAQTHVDATAIFLLNPYTLQLEYAAGHGFKSGAVKKAHFRLGGSLAGRSALERRIIAITNDLSDQVAGNAPFAEFVKAESFVSYSAIPLVAKGKVKGVLEFFSRSQFPSDAEWLDFMKTLAHQAAIAMDNVELFDGLQRSNLELGLAYDATIEGWSRAMDLRDHDTEGHSLRVTEITERLARALGMSEVEIVNIRRGALLHDIGKMGVPDAILHKPDKLTGEEWVLMRKHPQYAYDMLWPIPYLRPALDIPYCHHEKWDGSGYPRGLKGETIPLAARIFAVVDVWDALVSDRPYRSGWPVERVRTHIREAAGTHFDPQVVEAFFKLHPDDLGIN
jgi:PAS domain S-box-containing protein/putative nucleotidyltransferase with HDIG domain